MKRIGFVVFSLIFLSIGVMVYRKATTTSAAVECRYGSTQARVQRDLQDPWKPEITITHGESFNVGSFHDGTGQFAQDTLLQVQGPGMLQNFQNGNTVKPPHTGTYILYVATHDQYGSGCTEQARVIVKAKSKPTPTVKPTAPPTLRPTPLPTPDQSCPYGSTQARVQHSIDHDWQQVIGIWRGGSFNVGSFHDQTGRFANDTKLVVSEHQGNFRQEYRNGERVSPPGTGWYQLKVSTPGKTGDACQQSAWVYVW